MFSIEVLGVLIASFILGVMFAYNYESRKTSVTPKPAGSCTASTGKDVSSMSTTKQTTENQDHQDHVEVEQVPVRILYATKTQTAKRFAATLTKQIFALNVTGFHFDVSATDLQEYDQDNLEQEKIVIFLMPTWEGGVPPDTGAVFYDWLEDQAMDFRVSKLWLQSLHFAVYGLGTALYDENWCRAAKKLNGFMLKLGGRELTALGKGDDSGDMESHFKQWCNQLVPTLCDAYRVICNGTEQIEQSSGCGSGCNCGNNDEEITSSPKKLGKRAYRREKREKQRKDRQEAARAAEAEGGQSSADVLGLTDGGIDEEDLINEKYLADEVDSDDELSGENSNPRNRSDSSDGGLVDVEDIGAVMNVASKEQAERSKTTTPRNMVTPAQYRALTKEGYKIIGTHSAVKLCRWTKHQLRGRGGCYKHTCYGITSYQCMETTPSLACANKCVFCWRHHKNPVGREWRWTIDDPAMIVDQAIDNHCQMIKAMKGVPGVKMERWQEGFTVKHCALSLVGEPIMYPHINRFIELLHERNISSFLVTNAQFPEAIASLEPVTQLYVSIDAATKDTLRAIDRPLFKDFWERFMGSLDALRQKGQRTVYRLTLVKSYNMAEVKNYCELIRRGDPDFIEIKAVTYCGKSDGSDLTIKDVPWHEEVRNFCEAIAEEMGGVYGLACEHEHSNLVLLARRTFYRFPSDVTRTDNEGYKLLLNGEKNDVSGDSIIPSTGVELKQMLAHDDARRFAHLDACHVIRGNDTKDSTGQFGSWYTWIDYTQFHKLAKRYTASNGKNSFTSLDYVDITPSWSVYNATEKGFDPKEVRFRRTKDGKVQEYEAPPGDAGCG